MKVLLIIGSEFKELPESFAIQNVWVDSTSSYQFASELISLYEYDCVLIHLDFQKSAGFDWITKFVETNKREGIVVISSLDSLEQKLKAFDLGVDDYVQIPFHNSELIARIKAVVRRKKFDTNSKIYFGNMMIDLLSYKVFVWNNPLFLTKKEYDILLHLIANKNKVISKTALGEYLWGEELDNFASYNVLIAHIKNLRKKLLSAKAGVEIKNSYAIGYQIIEV